MPTTTSPELEDSVLRPKRRLLEWLEESFAAEFHFAASRSDGPWRRTSIERSGAESSNSGALAELSDVEAGLCQRVVDGQGPQAAPHPDGGCLLAMPLVGGPLSFQIAYGYVAGGDPDLVLQMARLWLSASKSKFEAERFQIENEFFAEQLTDGLEELTFLRSMVEHLDVTDSANDLLALAKSTLPLLNDTVKAECLTLLMVEDGDQPLDADPVLCVGPKQVSDLLPMRIVQWFGAAALEQPVVKNRLAGAPEGEKIPGVREFVLVPLAARNRLMGWLLAINRTGANDYRPNSNWPMGQLEYGTSEASLLSTTASILATHASNLELFREKEQILTNVVRSLVSAVEAKDEYTCGHSERVALYGRILAEQVGYAEDDCERLYLTGLLHDVGKIGVSDAVLKKAGNLTDEEFDEIKRHPDEGWAILHDLEQLRYVLPGVLYHHERYDGRGYPDELSGEEIPIDGRILAVVDAYDAMTSDRPYRAGMPAERAQDILRSGAGTQWDADLVDHFFAALEKIERVRCNYRPRNRPERSGVIRTAGSLPELQA